MQTKSRNHSRHYLELVVSTVIIVQARMGSKRFPGKILAPFLPAFPGGPDMPVLWHVLKRCLAVPKVYEVILATPYSAIHQEAWDLAIELGCGWSAPKSNENDVLDRYYKTAKAADLGGGDHIVRITADCPLIDPQVANEVITLHLAQQADYSCNIMPRTYPKGFDCEVMTFDALEACWLMAKSAYDQEHVTPWLQRHTEIKRANLQQKINQSKVNLCVDYPGDIPRIKKLLETWKPAQCRIQ